MQKDISLKFEDKIYSCKIESTDGQTLSAELSEEMLLKFKGCINLKDIYNQIRAFDDYTMEEIFTVMKDMSEDKFNITKESDKLKLDIKFTVMKKDKHLIMELNPVSESNDSIIQRLVKMNKNIEERIKALEKEINEIKNQKTNKAVANKNEKAKNDSEVKQTEKIENKTNLTPPKKFVKLSNESYKDEDINLNIKGCSLLILKDGRISIGTEKDGIYIYDPDNFKECMHLKDYGSLQAQSKDEMLVTVYDEKIAIIKLKQDNYEIKMRIDCYDPILYVEALDSNYVAAGIKYRERMYIYKLDENYTYYEKNSISLGSYASCKYILNVNNEEMLYIVNPDSYSAIKKAVFYNYISGYNKSINIYVDLDTNPISKISKNLIAAASETKITLIDIKQHKVAKIIDTNKHVFCLYPINEKYLIVGNIDEETGKNFLQQYEINDMYSHLNLEGEKNDMKIDSFILRIGYLNNGSIVLLTYSGGIKLLSAV